MEKLKLHAPNLTQANLAKLAELFPQCVTEALGGDGKSVIAIDLDVLRQELSTNFIEGSRERYQLTWPGKNHALLAANAPIAKTLRHSSEESVDWENTKNIFIEGDSLDALKLIQETYLNKIKMIYIDPPYNTGNDFIYEDDFSSDPEDYFFSSSQIDEIGNRLVANTEANGRFHSDWLSMLYSRMRLAWRLLADDGVIFVSIDDNESSNLIKICNEIFGEKNFIAQIIVQVNPRGRHLDRFIAKTHDYIIVYGKNATNSTTMRGLKKEGRMLEEYNREDERGKFRLLGLRNRNQAFNPETRPKLYYPMYVRPSDGAVSLNQDAQFTDRVLPDAPDGVKTCWTWGKEKVKQEGQLLIAEKTGEEWRIYRRDYLVNEGGEAATTLPKSIWLENELSNDYGRQSVKDLFGAAVMDFPKSPVLIKKLLMMGMRQEGIVLDFFAGSATTAHAVLELNAEDNGNRRFILVQLPEPTSEKSAARKAGFQTISELAKERIRRAGKVIKEEHAVGDDLDIGFRVYKVDTSNMRDVFYRPDEVSKGDLLSHVDNIKEDRTPEDLLFQILLDWGVDLSLSIANEKINGKTVYFVDQNALAACFETGVTEELVKQIAARHPLRVVFRDNGFSSDSVKINVEQIFKLLSPETEVMSI
jgi:adenine-specific DNA-methyltransferase